MVEIGKPVEDIELPATGGQNLKISDYRGKNLVLYFYPRDNTPGCTSEGVAFANDYEAYQACNADILGVSRESVKSHETFKAKFDFPFELLSDKEEKLCRLFNVIKEKNMYGRKVLGIERSTFVIDKDGILIKEWRGVKVKEHTPEVLAFMKELDAN